MPSVNWLLQQILIFLTCKVFIIESTIAELSHDEVTGYLTASFEHKVLHDLAKYIAMH